MNGITPHSRIEGLNPCAEDWHTKMNLLDVRMRVELHTQINQFYCCSFILVGYLEVLLLAHFCK